jgi:hypothetical protein
MSSMPFTCCLSALVLAQKGYFGGSVLDPTSARLVITGASSTTAGRKPYK